MEDGSGDETDQQCRSIYDKDTFLLISVVIYKFIYELTSVERLTFIHHDCEVSIRRETHTGDVFGGGDG